MSREPDDETPEPDAEGFPASLAEVPVAEHLPEAMTWMSTAVGAGVALWAAVGIGRVFFDPGLTTAPFVFFAGLFVGAGLMQGDRMRRRRRVVLAVRGARVGVYVQDALSHVVGRDDIGRLDRRGALWRQDAPSLLLFGCVLFVVAMNLHLGEMATVSALVGPALGVVATVVAAARKVVALVDVSIAWSDGHPLIVFVARADHERLLTA